MRKTKTTIILAILLLVSSYCLTDSDADSSNTEETVKSYDGGTYTYETFSVPSYFSAVYKYEPGNEDHVRIQSRLEGYELQYINDYSFSENKNVISYLVPAGVNSLGIGIFSGCDNLAEIIFLGNVPDASEKWCDGITKSKINVHYPKEYAEEWKSFLGYNWGKSSGPLDEKTYTGECSFSYFEYDDGITVSKYISGTEITIPDTLDGKPVTDIGSSAFACEENDDEKPRIASVTFGSNIKTIHVAAFKYCEYLETVIFNDGLENICDEAFRMPIDNVKWERGKINGIQLPDGLKYIGFEAFRMSYSLEEITIPESVEHYGDGAFRVCPKLEKIEFLCDMETLGDSSFDECHSLKEIVLPNGLTQIGKQAFLHNYSLETIIIPDTVKTIEDETFSGCVSLYQITVSDNCELGENSFKSTVLQTVVITLESENNYDNGIIKTYFSTGGNWKLPGAEKQVSLLTVDTNKEINVNLSQKPGSFVKFTERTVNTVGGHFYDGTTELTESERAGNSFGSTEGKYRKCEIATLILNVTPIGLDEELHGIVSGGTTLGGGTYKIGTDVVFGAYYSRGYVFEKWDDGCEDSERTLKLNEDKTFTAYFVKSEKMTLDLSVDGEGGKVEGSSDATFYYGDTREIKAIPDKGFEFVSWSDGNKEQTRILTFTDENINLKASFEEVIFTVTVILNPENAATVYGSGDFRAESEIEISFAVNPGYRFVVWGDGDENAKKIIVLKENITLTVYFGDQNSSVIFASINGNGGTVSGWGIYGNGEKITLTATADQGYRFLEWSDGNKEQTRTITVKDDLVVTAKFIPDSKVTVAKDDRGYLFGGTILVVGGIAIGSWFVLQKYRKKTLSANDKKLFASLGVMIVIAAAIPIIGMTEKEIDNTQGVVIDFGYYDSVWTEMAFVDGMDGFSCLETACDINGFELTYDKNTGVKSINGQESLPDRKWNLYYLDDTEWIKIENPDSVVASDYKLLCWARVANPEEIMPATDATGHTFYKYAKEGVSKNTGKPLTVACLAPSVTETVCSVGGLEYIIGTDVYSNYPQQIVERQNSGIITYTGGYTDPNYEWIIKLSPDIVFCDGSAPEQVTIADKLRKSGINCVVLYNGSDINALYKNIWICASSIGFSSNANEIIGDIRETMDSVSGIMSLYNRKIFVSLSADPTPWTAGSDTYINDIIKQLGETNIFESQASSWFMVSKEQIFMKQPDAIIIISETEVKNENDYQKMLDKMDPVWKETPAFKNGNVFVFSGKAADVMSRPGPRLSMATELMAKLLDPDSFLKVNPDDAIPNKWICDDYEKYLTHQKLRAVY